MKNLIACILLTISVGAYAQKNASIDPKLIGKWNAISKIETDKAGGTVIDSDKKLYKTGEKTYEFTKKNTVIIIQKFGKHQEELPAYSSGSELFIGKSDKHKTPYVVSYVTGGVKLLKTKNKTKKGKAIVETEEVILQH